MGYQEVEENYASNYRQIRHTLFIAHRQTLTGYTDIHCHIQATHKQAQIHTQTDPQGAQR